MFSTLREAVEAIAPLGRKDEDTPILVPRWEQIPSALTAIDRWCGWQKDKEGRKVPQSPRTGGRAFGTNLIGNYTRFSFAQYRSEQKGWDGVGFVFDGSDGLVGLDLDDCVTEDGELLPWAAYIVERLGVYTEISPSGTGVKMWAYAPTVTLPNGKDGCNWGSVEAYLAGRWFATTGHVLSPWCGEDRSEAVQELVDAAHAVLKPKKEAEPHVFKASVSADVESRYGKAVLERECGKVAGAAEGTRNTTLNTAAFKVGQLVGGGVIPEEEAVRALSDAAKLVGLGEEETRGTIKSGLGAGKDCPRYVPADAAESVDLSAFCSFTEPDDGEEEGTHWIVADPGPFPEELLYVPGLIDAVVNHNLRTAHRRQPVLALAGAIALQAVLCGRKIRDVRNNRTNLYIVSISESGTGKEHARQVNSEALLPTNLEGHEDIASDSGLINNLSDRPCMLMQIDEFGKFLRALSTGGRSNPHLTNIIKVLLQIYTSANRLYRGKAYADIEKAVEVDQACLIVHGTGVPSDFYAALTKESLEDGLLARLGIFEGERRPKRQEIEEDVEIPPEVTEAVLWWRDFQPTPGLVGSMHPKPKIVPATAEAKAMFSSMAEEIEEAIGDEEGWGRSIWARCEEKACKLALVYACSRDREEPVIDVEAARWACKLALYLTRRLLFLASSHVSESDFDSKQKALMRLVDKNGGGVTQTQIGDWFGAWDRKTRNEVVSNLLEIRKLVARQFGPGPKKGIEYVRPDKLHTDPGCFNHRKDRVKNGSSGF